jgi:hypothetical protein
MCQCYNTKCELEEQICKASILDKFYFETDFSDAYLSPLFLITLLIHSHKMLPIAQNFCVAKCVRKCVNDSTQLMKIMCMNYF